MFPDSTIYVSSLPENKIRIQIVSISDFEINKTKKKRKGTTLTVKDVTSCESWNARPGTEAGTVVGTETVTRTGTETEEGTGAAPRSGRRKKRKKRRSGSDTSAESRKRKKSVIF